MMGTINIRTVRRSHAFLDYGADFCYQEYSTTKNEEHARKMAAASQRGGPPPEKIQEMIDAGRLPKPGEGPGPEARAVSTFATTHYAESASGARAVARVSGGEAGYEETAKMVSECAIALALRRAPHGAYAEGALACGQPGGVFTPAFAFGAVMVARLRAAGIAIDVRDFADGDDVLEEEPPLPTSRAKL